MRKAFKINELGRSMVEMLGVLAVVGVLSIGAIQGYRYAFNKYNANETINELNIRAHDISQRMDQIIESNFVGIIDMEMGNVTRSGYPVTARTHPQYVDFFEMFVSDVPSDVCKQILQSNWKLPFSTFVNIKRYEGDVSICDDTETVTIAYEFHEDLLGETDLEEEDRHELQRCNHTNDCYCGSCNTETGICETYCAVGEKCSIDYNNPRNRVCCPTDYVAGQYCCSFVSPEGKCCDKNGTCCPEDKPIVDKYGGCHSCDETSSFLMANTKLCTDLCENKPAFKKLLHKQNAEQVRLQIQVVYVGLVHVQRQMVETTIMQQQPIVHFVLIVLVIISAFVILPVIPKKTEHKESFFRTFGVFVILAKRMQAFGCMR